MKEIDVDWADVTAREQALAEFHFMKKLNHPNIISVIEQFEDEQEEKIYIVMEYADGGDLSQRIREKKRLPVEQRCGFSEDQVISWSTSLICNSILRNVNLLVLVRLIQICFALRHVHSRKILHRDIKTPNIFLMHDNTVKVGDFGVARHLDNTFQHAQTQIGRCYCHGFILFRLVLFSFVLFCFVLIIIIIIIIITLFHGSLFTFDTLL
jgi:NIMA (never in mitosis gene a)-related kinase